MLSSSSPRRSGVIRIIFDGLSMKPTSGKLQSRLRDTSNSKAGLRKSLAEQPSSVTAERDIAYMISRLRKEGYPFIGVALPAFARDFESSLRVGHCRDAPFLGFRRAKGRWLPSFLSGFTSRIFSQDGTVLPNADPFCIYAVRQITLAWAKCLFPI